MARAIDDGLELQDFSGEYIANILAVRRRIGPEPAALQLTRRSDLLELTLPEPDLSNSPLAKPPRELSNGKCQLLLSERSILAAMAYVDLNPIRAKVARVVGQKGGFVSSPSSQPWRARCRYSRFAMVSAS